MRTRRYALAFDDQIADCLAREALKAAQSALPTYSSIFSRKDYTQHHLFVLLVLRQFFKTGFRGVVQLVNELSDLCKALGLKKVLIIPACGTPNNGS